MENILNTLMPQAVGIELREMSAETGHLPCHRYDAVTVVQSDLVGFTKLSSGKGPTEVVEIISDLFRCFDDLADKYGVYKVETVGDAYIAGQADKILTDRHSVALVANFGLALIEETTKWASKRDFDVGCRVGLTTGECIGGIVGNEM